MTMTFIHTSGTERGRPPTEGTRTDTGQTVSGIQPDDLAMLAACGWHPVTDTPQPPDTATDTHDRSIDPATRTVVWTKRPWTADEQTGRTHQANRQTIEGQAAAALAANATFLAKPTPTATEVRIQTQALTRQVNGLIRLILGRLDST